MQPSPQVGIQVWFCWGELFFTPSSLSLSRGSSRLRSIDAILPLVVIPKHHLHNLQSSNMNRDSIIRRTSSHHRPHSLLMGSHHKRQTSQVRPETSTADSSDEVGDSTAEDPTPISTPPQPLASTASSIAPHPAKNHTTTSATPKTIKPNTKNLNTTSTTPPSKVRQTSNSNNKHSSTWVRNHFGQPGRRFLMVVFFFFFFSLFWQLIDNIWQKRWDRRWVSWNQSIDQSAHGSDIIFIQDIYDHRWRDSTFGCFGIGDLGML